MISGIVASAEKERVFFYNSPFVCWNHTSVDTIICKIRPFVVSRFFDGFTLIELIITLLIFAILITLAAPSFSRFLESNRLTGVANDLISDLNLARSESIKRAADVKVCQSSNGSSCTTSAVSWSSGWIVITDTTVIRAHEALPAGISVTASAHTITYQNQGQAATGAGLYTLCNSRLPRKVVIDVNSVGRYNVNQEDGACS